MWFPNISRHEITQDELTCPKNQSFNQSIIFLKNNLNLHGIIHTLLPGHFLMSRVFANGLADWGSIPGRVIPKTQKRYLMLPRMYQG